MKKLFLGLAATVMMSAMTFAGTKNEMPGSVNEGKAIEKPFFDNKTTKETEKTIALKKFEGDNGITVRITLACGKTVRVRMTIRSYTDPDALNQTGIALYNMYCKKSIEN